MIKYEDTKAVFQKHLGDRFSLLEFYDNPKRFRDHTALSMLLTMAFDPEYTKDNLLPMLAELVTDLQRNGDDKCQEMVHVSFFENMDWRSREEVAAVRQSLPADMQKVMDDAFKALSYSY